MLISIKKVDFTCCFSMSFIIRERYYHLVGKLIDNGCFRCTVFISHRLVVMFYFRLALLFDIGTEFKK